MAKKTIRKSILPDEVIINKIYLIRGHKVMLDKDLAEMYGVETKRLKEAVKRNAERFPKDFMFALTQKEFQYLRSQIATSSWGGSRYMPFAFTEQGVAMLSGVINSSKAIEMNIAIMRAFVEMRKLAHGNKKIAAEIKKLIDKVGEHDIQLASIYDAIEDLLDKKVEERKWDERERIGFKK
jgi:phage regulator Rha-like protein